MNKTIFLIVLTAAYLGMGASGCESTPPDVVGTWLVKCEYTNPVSKAEYYWQFFKEPEPTQFKSWETLADGTVKVIDSFYIYQQSVMSIKNPEVENGDRFYQVSATDADHLNFKGGEYTCTLERGTNPHDKPKNEQITL
ncbi:MAG: hypothetical protein SGI74_10685 [Oligoflexia bacterium]|nr:hypothetical protein [Oligoflexia bacterium]